MPTSTKPSIIIGCGLHHVAHHFRYLSAALHESGYKNVTIVQLPSVSKTYIENAMGADVEAIKNAIQKTNGEILLILHSWAAFVGCKAMEGFETRVKGIVFVGGWLQPSGKSSCEWLGIPELPIYSCENGIYTTLDARGTFFNDLSKEEADDAMEHIVPFLVQTVGHTPLTYEYPWENGIACTNIILDDDKAIPPAFGEKMIQDCGVTAKVFRMPGGHSPFLGQLPALMGIVRRAAGENVQLEDCVRVDQ